MKKYLLSLDQGTTSSRAVLFDMNLRMVASEQQEFTQLFPEPGRVEHDPMEIWNSQLAVTRRVMERFGVESRDIASIGITNQRETTVIWNRNTGEPVGNAIVWQDRRTAEICGQLIRDGWEERIRERTGLVVDAYFSATKIKWILDHIQGARKKAESGELAFGTVDSWLIWNLTGGAVHATDLSNASRTMLFNIHSLQWDRELMSHLDIPVSILPEVRPSCGDFGSTASGILPGGSVSIGGVAGDQQSALFGQACLRPGMAKNTYGTGCFMLMHTGGVAVRSESGLLTTIAWGVNGQVEYALEGSVFIAGAAIQWLRDSLQLIDHAAESEELAASVPDSGGVYVVPAFAGLGAPYWDMYARGAILGLTRGSRKEHLVRATLESLAYQTHDVLRAMEKDAGRSLSILKVDGGASANALLMQFQADILGVPVERPSMIESTALGAACLAGLSAGCITIEDLPGSREEGTSFLPQMDESEREIRLLGWRKAVDRCRNWDSA